MSEESKKRTGGNKIFFGSLLVFVLIVVTVIVVNDYNKPPACTSAEVNSLVLDAVKDYDRSDLEFSLDSIATQSYDSEAHKYKCSGQLNTEQHFGTISYRLNKFITFTSQLSDDKQKILTTVEGLSSSWERVEIPDSATEEAKENSSSDINEAENDVLN